jgi:hypothetical protein
VEVCSEVISVSDGIALFLNTPEFPVNRYSVPQSEKFHRILLQEKKPFEYLSKESFCNEGIYVGMYSASTVYAFFSIL